MKQSYAKVETDSKYKQYKQILYKGGELTLNINKSYTKVGNNSKYKQILYEGGQLTLNINKPYTKVGTNSKYKQILYKCGD